VRNVSKIISVTNSSILAGSVAKLFQKKTHPNAQLAKYHQDLEKDKDIFLLLGMMQNAEEAVVR